MTSFLPVSLSIRAEPEILPWVGKSTKESEELAAHAEDGREIANARREAKAREKIGFI
jgi:hypothetical protein